MTMGQQVDLVFLVLSTVLAYLAAVSTLAIAVTYRLFFDWKRTPAGRVFSQFLLALAAVFVLATLVRVLGPDYPGRYFLTTLVFGWWAVTTVRMFVELIASWRHGVPRLFDLEPKPRKKEEDPS